MTENKYAVTGWAATPTKEVELPSGQLCLVRKLTMEDVLELNLVNKLDSFSSELLESTTPKKAKAANRSKKNREEDELKGIMDLLSDKERFASLKETVDAVVQHCVIQPILYPKPQNNEFGVPDYIEGRAYIDTVDFTDKMTLFTEMFQGLGDLSRFRAEQASDLGNVEAKSGAGDTPVADGSTD